jgi:hypothetical protein
VPSLWRTVIEVFIFTGIALQPVAATRSTAGTRTLETWAMLLSLVRVDTGISPLCSL